MSWMNKGQNILEIFHILPQKAVTIRALTLSAYRRTNVRDLFCLKMCTRHLYRCSNRKLLILSFFCLSARISCSRISPKWYKSGLIMTSCTNGQTNECTINYATLFCIRLVLDNKIKMIIICKSWAEWKWIKICRKRIIFYPKKAVTVRALALPVYRRAHLRALFCLKMCTRHVYRCSNRKLLI